MSHVAKIEVEIRDLEALAAACQRIGCELHMGQREYAWFGTSVGDYPLPEGFKAADLGKCEHAISVPGASYEVGVVARRDGRQGYTLLWDSWSSGGLERKLGQGASRLVQAYGVEAATRAARRQGYSVTETTREDGAIVLKVRA
jgi:hypothetical protein